MKKSLVAMVTGAVLLASGATMAQDTKSPSPARQPAAQAGSRTDSNVRVGPLDERMMKMQALHDRMAAVTTAAERQKLMDEQRRSMHESMAVMNQMMQGSAAMGSAGGMGGGMGGGMMGQNGKPADAGTQMLIMQRRMDMMQVMMQSMMDQMGPVPGPGGMDAAPKK